MVLDYVGRTEMASMSKEVRELYFAALELLDALDEAGLKMLSELVLQEPELESVDRLRRAVQDFQGEELANGNNDQD